MNLADANSSTYLTCNNENNPKFKKDPKFKVGDHVWISKYKNIIAKGHVSNCSEDVFLIKVKSFFLS